MKEELYRSKVVTVDQALSRIKSGDIIGAGLMGNEPQTLLRNLHTIADRVENVTVWFNLTCELYQFISDNSLRGKIDMISGFYGPEMRMAHKAHRVSIVPTDLHNMARAYMGRPLNVFLTACTPPDEDGYVSLSNSTQHEVEMLDYADMLICEVNPLLPHINGQTKFPIEKVECFVETSNPVPGVGAIPITDVERKIASYVLELVEDGDCIQLGIGGMPNAVGEALVCKKDLGIHTEMITSSMGMLMQKGVVTNERKNIHKGVSIGAFAHGSPELYKYLDYNPIVEIKPAAYVNNPFVIAQNDHMVSINTALQIDLTGQVCSESIGLTQFSGTGGASDFAYGAFHSKGGKGIIAVNSTAKGGTVSRIQPFLTPGSVVSIRRNNVDYIVTEYGIAHLKFKSVSERLNELINIAHPDFRQELRKQAEDLHIW